MAWHNYSAGDTTFYSSQLLHGELRGYASYAKSTFQVQQLFSQTCKTKESELFNADVTHAVHKTSRRLM